MTLTTIKKTAPLALLAVAMSGSALAGNNGQNNGSDKGRKGEPQGSISVVTSCSLCGDPSAPGYDPANYVNCDLTNPTLYVSAEIIDETGDLEPDASITLQFDVDASAQRRDKGGKDAWTGIGDASIDLPSADGTWDATFDLCALDPTIDGAKAASGIVNVVVTNLDASKEAYSGSCENFDPDPSTAEDEDGIDQSNFNIRELGVTCSAP